MLARGAQYGRRVIEEPDEAPVPPPNTATVVVSDIGELVTATDEFGDDAELWLRRWRFGRRRRVAISGVPTGGREVAIVHPAPGTAGLSASFGRQTHLRPSRSWHQWRNVDARSP